MWWGWGVGGVSGAEKEAVTNTLPQLRAGHPGYRLTLSTSCLICTRLYRVHIGLNYQHPASFAAGYFGCRLDASTSCPICSRLSRVHISLCNYQHPASFAAGHPGCRLHGLINILPHLHQVTPGAEWPYGRPASFAADHSRSQVGLINILLHVQAMNTHKPLFVYICRLRVY